jgi:hypothetical protein
MTGKLKEARVHVDIAKEIDPDFCDIGYQEAILQVNDERQGVGIGKGRMRQEKTGCDVI